MTYCIFTEKKMLTRFKKSFPKIEENECLETINKKEFEIYDCVEDNENCITGKCYITEIGNFKVINEYQKELHFLAIDKCIFFDDDTFKKCDCLVFDEKTISFIEIKDCKQKNRKARKKDAKSQLKNTILILKDKIDKEIEAYLCIGYTNTKPSILASSLDALVEFEEELKTKLLEGCQKEFLK